HPPPSQDARWRTAGPAAAARTSAAAGHEEDASWRTAGPAAAARAGAVAGHEGEGLALVDRGSVLCANPTCRFLVHTDSCFGGYCCRRCHWIHETGHTDHHDRHGCRCQRQPAGPGAPRAAPMPPHEVYSLFGSI
ncbi:unnamed protein product, partial [Prorocentrum cordatum]